MTIRNLPLLGSLFLSGLLTLGACGSSSSSGTGGTSGSLGGTTGAVGGHGGGSPGTGGAGGHVAGGGGNPGTGGAGVGGASGNVSCPQTAVPTCLQPFTNCLPAGTCTQQMTGAIASGTFGFNNCYSNGVKSIATDTVDLATQSGNVTITVSKGGTVCFTETATQAIGDTNPVISIKNAAGTTVATLMDSADGTGTVVTCTGGAAVVLPDGCDFTGAMDMTTGDCTDGVCQ